MNELITIIVLQIQQYENLGWLLIFQYFKWLVDSFCE